ncbi:hypothetical protein VB715_02230 [Crocosphaera sp. UHCC 0190]|uniref:hypothetical protein n=1 Tax=Crocosphaera sp. UHCC 0190 TaxID=3110246 RepID=UPI002B20E773|nr:hypothetical protein [Crocosphaera sp. UHCC 0190]MEA5508573.1 hypothetical protein [Crocosphaera sp. UHCC 0190]
MSKYQLKKQSVFSFINLLIAGIIITIVFIIAFSNLLENPESRQIRQGAEKNLRLFARGNSLNAINCDGLNNNQDGWINCRATDRKGQAVSIECPNSSTEQDCRYINQ